MPPRSKASLVDTNVVLRYLLEDDPRQSPLAAAFFKKVEEASVHIEIEDGVLAETIWVLERGFRTPRSQIAGLLIQLVLLDGVQAAMGKATLIEALTSYSATRIDFVDCLLAARARAAGVKVFSFDDDFRSLACVSEEPR